MDAIKKFINGIKSREPAATAGAVRVILLTLVSFGVFRATEAQIAQALILVECLLTYWVRANVVSADQHELIVSTARALPQGSTEGQLLDALKGK